jgi:hypothetical protein
MMPGNIFCMLIEEAKTETEWMFYIHTSRVVRTDLVCKAMADATEERLSGTFFIDEAHYPRRHAFSRMQHFRFFCMQRLGQVDD